MLQFNKRRTKSLGSWLAILLTPGVLMLVPGVNLLTLPVWLLWLNIPAFLLSAVGIRSYEFQEFGALPKGPTDLAFIVGFWVIAAFFLSWITNRFLSSITNWKRGMD
ncbi:MAG: hypothetical protein V3W34_06585 [Phycisphaerae bacterium]